jgi:hypothetical protein
LNCGGGLNGQKIALNGQKIALTVIVVQTDNFTTRDGQARDAANSVETFLDADVPGDNSVFGTDANRHENNSHNGCSGFSGNTASAEAADLGRDHFWRPIFRPPSRSGGG